MTNYKPEMGFPGLIPEIFKNQELREGESSVEINSEGQRLSAKLFLPADDGKKHPAVLFAHGWLSDQIGYAEYARELVAQGYACLTFDFRGQGKSEGDIRVLTRRNFLNDAMNAYDFLARSPGVDSEKISVMGASFGGYIAAILSENRKLESIVLRVPADYPDDGFDEPRMQTTDKPGAMEWRGQIRDAEDTEALRAIHNFTGNLLVVESGKDNAVLPGTIQSYLRAAPDPEKVSYALMEDAPHSLGMGPKFRTEFKEILSDFFNKESTQDI